MKKKLILLGLSFKVDSDDVRGSGSMSYTENLKKKVSKFFQ